MKSTFSKKFINTLVLSGLILSLFIFGLRISSTANAQSDLALLDRSGGILGLFNLWPIMPVEPPMTPLLDSYASLIGQTTSKVVFRQLGTTILGDIFGFNDGFFNEMYAGFSSLPEVGGGVFQSNPSQGLRLQVDGSIQIKSLAHSNDTPIKLCTNDFGKLAHCGGFTPGGPGGPGGPGTGGPGGPGTGGPSLIP